MDWVLSGLDPLVGISLEDNLRVNHLAFVGNVSSVAITNGNSVPGKGI